MADHSEAANRRSGPALGHLKIKEMYEMLCSEAGISYEDFMQAVKSLPSVERNRRDFTLGMAALTQRLIKLKAERKVGSSMASVPIQLSLPFALYGAGNDTAIPPLERI